MSLLRRFNAWWGRHRHASDTFSALRALDTRTLRDLGLHRSELQSIAREISGLAERQRHLPYY